MTQQFNAARIAHISAALPSKKLYNLDNPNFDEKDKRRLVKKVGVTSRYVVDREKGERLLDLYIKAGLDSLERLGWAKDSIDAIIVLSQSHEYKFPSTACILQDRLGLRNEVIAFDASLGCSGYVYGLNIAFNYAANGANRILLFVGEASQDTASQKDRHVAFLFGDAVACTAIEALDSIKARESHLPSTFYFKTLGRGYDYIIMPKGGHASPITPKDFEEYIDKDGTVKSGICMQMKGLEVFDFTIEELPPALDKVLNLANLSLSNIDRFYLHQANLFILQFFADKFGISDRMPINIGEFGNTSSASIPLLICDTQGSNIRQSPVVMAGFGVGLSVAMVALELNCSTSIIGKQ